MNEIRFWNLMIKYLNKNFPKRGKMMLRKTGPKYYSVMMVNSAEPIQKELVDALQKHFKGRLDKKSIISDREIKLTFPEWYNAPVFTSKQVTLFEEKPFEGLKTYEKYLT